MSLLAYRRRQQQEYINRDPWDITVLRHAGNLSMVGRVAPAGARGAAATGAFVGEEFVGNISHCMILPWDSDPLEAPDLIIATHRESGIVSHFQVVFANRLPEVVEVSLEERQ